jgi:hypothetical protein
MMDFGARLDTIIEKAPALRKAGVIALTVDGCEIKLAPKESELPTNLQALLDDATAEHKDTHNPLNKPSTYGLPDGAELPGFARLIKQREHER